MIKFLHHLTIILSVKMQKQEKTFKGFLNYNIFLNLVKVFQAILLHVLGVSNMIREQCLHLDVFCDFLKEMWAYKEVNSEDCSAIAELTLAFAKSFNF